MYYVVVSGSSHFISYALRSNQEGLLLFILRTAQYFRGVNTIYTMLRLYFRYVDAIHIMHSVVFPGSYYYLYHVPISIFGEWILLILCSIFEE